MLPGQDAACSRRTGAPAQRSGRRGAFLAGDIFIRHVQKLCRSRQPIPRDHPGVSKVRIIRKPLKVTPRKKLRAAAQRSAAKYTEEDYSAEEPNVRLSRAFVVVLLLHVVAVGGIFAFSALKDRQASGSVAKTDKVEPSNGKGAGVQPAAMREPGTPEKSGTKSEAQKIIDSSRQT